MVKIYTGETPVEELQQTFTQELRGKMKEAALVLKCPVEELKWCVNSDGIVQIKQMTPNEMIEMSASEQAQKAGIRIRKDRGVF